MGASSVNYTGRTLNDETTTTLVEHHEALWMGFTVAQIKAKFYLDYLFITDDGASGFIGGCHVGSANYEMHNTVRLGSLVVDAEIYPADWRTHKLYLDAGLNTKGSAEKTAITSELLFDIRIEALFESSYFAASTAYGFRYRQRNAADTDWEGWATQDLQTLSGAILAQTSAGLESYSASTERKSMPFEIQPYFTNEEGTKYGAAIQIYPKAKSITFYGDATVYYIDTETIVGGTKLYDYDDFTGYHTGPSGAGDFYVDSRYYWRYDYDVSADAWIFIELIDTNPPVPITPLNFHYTGYSESFQSNANAQVTGNAGLYEGDLWQDPDDGVWYTGYTGVSPTFVFSGVPDDGFYAEGDIAEVTSELHLISGVDQY